MEGTSPLSLPTMLHKKKEKIIATYVETGESPTKGQVGMKISYRHDF